MIRSQLDMMTSQVPDPDAKKPDWFGMLPRWHGVVVKLARSKLRIQWFEIYWR